MQRRAAAFQIVHALVQLPGDRPCAALAFLLASIACIAIACATPRRRPRRSRRRRRSRRQAEPLHPGRKPAQEIAAAARHRRGKSDPEVGRVDARHGPGRDVPIDTRSGTWMSLDVSPDGREIAFDLLGDIYVMPIGGGEARAADQRPRLGHAAALLARAAREIAFTSDRGGGDNIWVMSRDGSDPRAITKEDFRLLNQARLDARRQFHRRAQAFHLARARWARARCGSTTAPASARACR